MLSVARPQGSSAQSSSTKSPKGSKSPWKSLLRSPSSKSPKKAVRTPAPATAEGQQAKSRSCSSGMVALPWHQRAEILTAAVLVSARPGAGHAHLPWRATQARVAVSPLTPHAAGSKQPSRPESAKSPFPPLAMGGQEAEIQAWTASRAAPSPEQEGEDPDDDEAGDWAEASYASGRATPLAENGHLGAPQLTIPAS